MTRSRAQDVLTAAIGVACAAGCTPREIQEAVELGFQDAGQLVSAHDAAQGRIGFVEDVEDDEVVEKEERSPLVDPSLTPAVKEALGRMYVALGTTA
jgi:hypothetical protein